MSYSKSAEAEWKFVAAASSLASTVFRSCAARFGAIGARKSVNAATIKVFFPNSIDFLFLLDGEMHGLSRPFMAFSAIPRVKMRQRRAQIFHTMLPCGSVAVSQRETETASPVTG